MSRYKAYPAYKDSGVEWLGKNPSHWTSTAIKYGYEITLGKMLQKEASSPTDELKPYLKAINIQNSGISILNVEEMWFSISELRSLRLKKGDLLISEGGDVGRSAIWNDELPECYIQNAINRARPHKKHSSKFLYYWMVMLKESSYIDVLCNKATIAHYTVDKLESSPLFLPPENEAQTIAAFLDHETAKIDALIEKQQRLIELLKEKRQAVISHAVTKGLNPNAPMKDSGVEWLGDIPFDWECVRLKFASELSGGKVAPSNEERYVGLENVQSNSGKFIATEEVIPEGISNVFSRGDVLFGKLRPYLAKSWLADFSGICSSEFLVMTSRKIDSKFLHYFTLTEEFIKQVDSSTYGSKMPRASWDYIGLLNIPIPSHESEKVAAFLDHETAKIDTLIEKQQRLIELAKERRTALISAAVTGKIDVRDWQAAA